MTIDALLGAEPTLGGFVAGVRAGTGGDGAGDHGHDRAADSNSNE